MPQHSYHENETILSKGEPASSLMFIISGSVNIHLNDHLIAKLTQGEVFGEEKADFVSILLAKYL